MRPNPYTTYPELPPQLPLPPSQLQRMQRQIDEAARRAQLILESKKRNEDSLLERLRI